MKSHMLLDDCECWPGLMGVAALMDLLYAGPSAQLTCKHVEIVEARLGQNTGLAKPDRGQHLLFTLKSVLYLRPGECSTQKSDLNTEVAGHFQWRVGPVFYFCI